MIWLGVFLACAPKAAPTSTHQSPPIKVVIAENEWAEDGLQVTINIHTSLDRAAFDRVVIQTEDQQLPFGFVQPLEGLGYRLEMILPIEHVPGQLIEGEVWFKGTEQPHSFALVSPFFEEDSHESH